MHPCVKLDRCSSSPLSSPRSGSSTRSTLPPSAPRCCSRSVRMRSATSRRSCSACSAPRRSAGLILVLGPGRALLAIASTPRPHIVHLVEVVAGVVVLVAAVVLWLKREGFARRLSTQSDRTRFSPLALGAVIIVAEFPTALPYFAALAAIVEARVSIPSQVLLVVVFNLCFCAPILILLGAVVAGGERGRAFARGGARSHSTLRRGHRSGAARIAGRGDPGGWPGRSARRLTAAGQCA